MEVTRGSARGRRGRIRFAARSALARATKTRGGLFRKYIVLFVAVVCVALLSNGLLEIYFSYQELKTSLIRLQRAQADAAAAPRSGSEKASSRFEPKPTSPRMR